MRKEINIEQVRVVLAQMESCAKEHPKANISFDLEKQRVNITYPLPKDYWAVRGFKSIF